MNKNIRYVAVIGAGAGAATIAELYAMNMHLDDRFGNHVRIKVISDEEVRLEIDNINVQLVERIHARVHLVQPMEIVRSLKRRGLILKDDKKHWVDRQRRLRGRQHQRLIFQRTTNK